ncbi:MAG: HAMP domain-containing sensor histidine kinase [Trueperaceae bacterium]|nr:HAMP domain-containing sensor histidine kinase [Trueperaceae bacterium]
MPESSAPQLVIATPNPDHGAMLAALATEMGLSSLVVDKVEGLLYHTRGSVPSAIILSEALAARVSQLDLIALLKRRSHLTHVPLICLGSGQGERQLAAIESGADLYLKLPVKPSLLKTYLQKLLAKRQAELELRRTIEKLRKVEEAYRDADRVKEDLTHMLVHDLKSPVSSVMGLLDHCVDILAEGGDEYGVVELLTLARGEARHLLNLAANILDVRRMKEGHMPYAPSQLGSLTDLAQQALQDVSGSTRDRHYSALVRPEAETLYVDIGLLRRILANLFANAIKHTRQNGHVDFRAWRADDHFVLSVRDDGEGIPEADQKRIFNAFEQSRHTVHDRFDTGMGLTFCKLAVEKHGGKIWVESKVGRGSTFLFTIPVGVAEQVEETPLLADQ